MPKLPRIVIDPVKLIHNFQTLQQRCLKAAINLNVVVKGVAGERRIIELLYEAGMTNLGDSRSENLREFQDYPGLHKLKLRLPSIASAATTVALADASLNAELATLEALNYYAAENQRRHQIFLMVDQGDQREGVTEEDLTTLAAQCRQFAHLEVIGLGANFSCFAGVMPTPSALASLVHLAMRLREEFDLPIRYVSGGNSSSLPLLYEAKLPAGVNHLRIGEGILLGRETLHGNWLPDLYHDAFVVEAEILQVQWKSGMISGAIGLDAFGRKPRVSRRETGWRVLLNMGEQDTPVEGLTALDPGVEVLGGSSDYLVLACERKCRVGQTLRFSPNYWSLLSLMSSRYVAKEYREC